MNIQKPTVSENMANRFRDILSPKKTIELKTNLKIRRCNGCPGKIKIGENMIIAKGGPLDPQYFHQRCYKGEHKK